MDSWISDCIPADDLAVLPDGRVALPGETLRPIPARARPQRGRPMECFYCGKKLVPVEKDKNGNGRVKSDSVTKDHLQPKARGGAGLHSNKVDACKECNFDKASLTLEEYRVVVAFRKKLIRPVGLLRFPGELP